MNGRPFGKYNGYYRYNRLDGTKQDAKTKDNDTALQSVFSEKFQKRIYLVLVADNPTSHEPTGDKMKDAVAVARPCKYLFIIIFKFQILVPSKLNIAFLC